jgi:hypothetical protein
MNKLGLIITVMLALTALYFLSTTMFKPSQPQVVVVRPQPQGSSQPDAQPAQPANPPPGPTSGPFVCTKAVHLRVDNVSLCADVLFSVFKSNDALHVEFQGGVVQGFFMFASAPSCTITTTPQGVLIPCRAQIMIPTKR